MDLYLNWVAEMCNSIEELEKATRKSSIDHFPRAIFLLPDFRQMFYVSLKRNMENVSYYL